MTWRDAFDPQNRFWNFMDKVTDVCLLSVLWLVCSLPVVTCGAATVSLLSYTLRQAGDDEGYAVRSFFRGMRRGFLPATGLWLVFLAGCAFFWADFRALGMIRIPQGVRVGVFSLLWCLALLFVLAMVWAFPLLARYDIPLKKALGDALPVAARHVPSTLAVLAIAALVVLLTVRVPFLGFLWFGLGVFVSSFFWRRALDGLS